MKMLKKLTVIIGVLIPFTAICQQNYSIKGKLPGVNAPAKVYLVEPFEQSVLDSATVKNGDFEFKGTIKIPELAVLYLNKDNTGFNKQLRDAIGLYLESGTIMVTSIKEFLYASKVSGTPNNDTKNAYSEMMSKAGLSIEKKIADLKKAANPDEQNEELFQMKVALLEKQKVDTFIRTSTDFIKSNPNSLISIRSLTELSDFEDYKPVNTLYETFTQNVRDSREGKKFAERLAVLKRVSLGSVAPDLATPDTTGSLVNLSSFRGKYLLVDVWASWCSPCRKENPNHVRNYQKFKDENFTMIGVSLDDDRKSWINAIHKDGLPWTQVSDLKGWDGKIISLYGLSSLPQNYLLDPTGVIVAKNLQGQDLYNKLTEIFGSD